MGEYDRKQRKQESRAIAYNGGGSRQLKGVVDNDINSIALQCSTTHSLKTGVIQCDITDKDDQTAISFYISGLQRVVNDIKQGTTITPELIVTFDGQEYDLKDDDKMAYFFDVLAESAGVGDINFKKAEILFDMINNAKGGSNFIHTVSINDESDAFEGAVDHKIKSYNGQNFIWIESIVSLAHGVGGNLITNIKGLLGRTESCYENINQIWLAAYAGSAPYYGSQGFVNKEDLYYNENDCSINEKTEDTTIDEYETFDIYTFTK